MSEFVLLFIWPLPTAYLQGVRLTTCTPGFKRGTRSLPSDNLESFGRDRHEASNHPNNYQLRRGSTKATRRGAREDFSEERTLMSRIKIRISKLKDKGKSVSRRKKLCQAPQGRKMQGHSETPGME